MDIECFNMSLRYAQTVDTKAICSLINYYAERGLMLHRSMESTYNSLREFQVATDDDGQIVGCVAVDIFWRAVAEVKSLAVAPDMVGQGIGGQLLTAAIEDARRMGVTRLFTLTYEQGFFQRQGFEVIDRHDLPEKVWRECLACSKADACDEIAMLLSLKDR
jgi:amino-acid N-acetyltransferase